MIVEEDLSNAEVTPREDRLQRSRVAQELAHWGTFSYQLALLFVVLCLLAGSAFAAFTPEPLGQRLMSLVFVAYLPAFAAYSIGSLTFWTLRGVSAIYDPVSSGLWLTFQRFVAWFVMDLMPSWLTNIIAFLRVCRRTVERAAGLSVAWAFGRVKRTGLQAASILGRWIAGCVKSARVCAQIIYRALRVAFVGTAAGARTCSRAVSWFIRQIVHALIWMRSTLAAIGVACVELASVCERITAGLLVRARRCCDKAWRVFIFGATFPVRLTAQILIWLIPSAA